jgi:hypothetical protein
MGAWSVVGCTDLGTADRGIGASDFQDGGRRGSSNAAERLDAGNALSRADAGVGVERGVSPPRDAAARGPGVLRRDAGPKASDYPPDASNEGSHASSRDAGAKQSGLPQDASNDGAPVSSGDAGQTVPVESRFDIPGWSVRKRVRSPNGNDVVLEEVLSGFADPTPGEARLRSRSPDGATVSSWAAPHGTVLSDFCVHPSGGISAILIAAGRFVSLERLSPGLTPLGELTMHDPQIASDPHVTDAGALDLLANGMAPDAARIASVDEGVVGVVTTSWNSVVAYRTAFANGVWGPPERTLVEPPVGLTPYLPIGGSFDTFGAMVVWYRPLLDVDEAGNAYVATWANSNRIREHVKEFQDGLGPLPHESGAGAHDSDVLVTKLDRAGQRLWSRVIGTLHEDEPYAIRAHAGAIAVVGRARRFPGFDNTTWDAFVSVVSSTGALVGSRTLPLQASGILLAVDALPAGGWVFGGSDGWAQNPDGLSVLGFGTKLLAVLPAMDGPLLRVPLAEGPRHNEIRTVLADSDHLWFGGHEDGPIMHTGDADPSLIVATGVLGDVHPVPSP